MRPALIWLAITGGTFILTVPGVVIHPFVPFAVLAALIGIFYLLRTRRGFAQHRKAYMLAFLATGLLLLPTALMFNFVESGFNDGPFSAQTYHGSTHSLVASDSLAYRGGQLVFYNRGDSESPLLEFRREDRTVWAVELDVSHTPGYEGTRFWRIEDPTITSGMLRDRVDFTGFWTYGVEHGYIFLWKLGGVQRFYLSW